MKQYLRDTGPEKNELDDTMESVWNAQESLLNEWEEVRTEFVEIMKKIQLHENLTRFTKN